jgi:hypothetical protein
MSNPSFPFIVAIGTLTFDLGVHCGVQQEQQGGFNAGVRRWWWWQQGEVGGGIEMVAGQHGDPSLCTWDGVERAALSFGCQGGDHEGWWWTRFGCWGKWA